MNMAQHKIVNLLKTLWDFGGITCHNVLNMWPKITFLLPVWPRDAKSLDTPDQCKQIDGNSARPQKQHGCGAAPQCQSEAAVKTTRPSLVRWFGWMECYSIHQKVASLILTGHIWEANNRCFCLMSKLVSLCLSVSLSIYVSLPLPPSLSF